MGPATLVGFDLSLLKEEKTGKTGVRYSPMPTFLHNYYTPTEEIFAMEHIEMYRIVINTEHKSNKEICQTGEEDMVITSSMS